MTEASEAISWAIERANDAERDDIAEALSSLAIWVLIERRDALIETVESYGSEAEALEAIRELKLDEHGDYPGDPFIGYDDESGVEVMLDLHRFSVSEATARVESTTESEGEA